VEISRHWRLIKDRYNLRGERRELEDGTVQFKLNGNTSWTEPSPNGHHKGENPFQGKIIYQAPVENEHWQEPILNQGEVEISVSTD